MEYRGSDSTAAASTTAACAAASTTTATGAATSCRRSTAARSAATSCRTTATAGAATTGNSVRKFTGERNGVVVGEIRSPVDAEIRAIQRTNRVPLRLLASDRSLFDFKIGAALEHRTGHLSAS